MVSERFMFEQSVLPETPSKRSYTFLAVTTAEVISIAAAIVIPLFFVPALTPPKLPVIVRFSRSVSLIKPDVTKTRPLPSSPRPALQAPHLLIAPYRIPTHITKMDDLASTDAPSVEFSSAPSQNGLVTGAVCASGTAAPLTPTPPKPVTKINSPEAPVHVSSGVQEAKLINKVVPVYPRLAMQTRQFGKVRLTTVIGKDGHVKNIQVLSGPAFLVSAAIEAVKQWVYRPTLLNGQPVEVIAPVEINFVLN